MNRPVECWLAMPIIVHISMKKRCAKMCIQMYGCEFCKEWLAKRLEYEKCNYR